MQVPNPGKLLIPEQTETVGHLICKAFAPANLLWITTVPCAAGFLDARETWQLRMDPEPVQG